MGLTEVIILLLAGLGTGFLVGLLGVGGGIIFVPVLLYYYKSIGIDSALVAELTVATSLFASFWRLRRAPGINSEESRPCYGPRSARESRAAWR